MGQVSISGVIVVGPSGNTTQFPGSETTIPIVGNTTEYVVEISGMQSVNSADAFVDVPTGTVTAGRLLYGRSETPLELRLSRTGAAELSLLKIDGMFLIEFSEDAPLDGLEVKGVGRFEYLIAGQS